jgi:FkbM family methyltransferase
MNLITLGSEYAQNTVPDGILNENSIYYGFGVGEDITFDIALIEKYNCNAYIFDPTPRSIKFVDNIKTISENKYPYNKICFFDYGIWAENTDIKFFEPKDKSHVSHSINNIQNTEEYFIAKVKTLETIIKELGHNDIDLLKLDIEGAEYSVIENIMKSNIFPKILIAEFHDINYINIQKKIEEQIIYLANFNYSFVAKANNGVTFIKMDF